MIASFGSRIASCAFGGKGEQIIKDCLALVNVNKKEANSLKFTPLFVTTQLKIAVRPLSTISAGQLLAWCFWLVYPVFWEQATGIVYLSPVTVSAMVFTIGDLLRIAGAAVGCYMCQYTMIA